MKTKPLKIKRGDVVQLHPSLPAWGCMFMVVQSWNSVGVDGYVMVPRLGEGDGRVTVQARWEHVARIGTVRWEIINARTLEDQKTITI